jgi:hypothetical protein
VFEQRKPAKNQSYWDKWLAAFYANSHNDTILPRVSHEPFDLDLMTVEQQFVALLRTEVKLLEVAESIVDKSGYLARVFSRLLLARRPPMLCGAPESLQRWRDSRAISPQTVDFANNLLDVTVKDGIPSVAGWNLLQLPFEYRQ